MRRSFSVSSSNSKSKRSSAELPAPDYVPLALRDEANGKRTNFGEGDSSMSLLPNHESNIPISESIKLVDDFSSSKRPRINYLETSNRSVRADDIGITFQKDVSDSVQCTYSEKNRMVKKKRGIEDKKTDKKNFRSSVRSRYDSTSKACFGIGDSTSRGNDILGSHGLKSDMSDVIKQAVDLDLTELLDGSYKYSNTCPTRGKKSSNSNENILHSIRKVISFLPSPFPASTTNNEKATVGLKLTAFPSNISNCDNKCSVTDEPVSSSKGPYLESCALFNGSSKEILQHLALPPGLVLDSLLDPNTIPVPSNTSQSSQSASLPSFPWSSSHVGSCKSNGDSGKLVSTRNILPSKWFRMENDSFSLKDNQNYLVDLKVETLVDKQKHEDCVIHSLDASKLSYDSLTSKVQPVSTSPTGIRSLDIQPSGTISEKLMNVPMDFSFMHPKYDNITLKNDIAVSRTSEGETSLRNWQDVSPITVEMIPPLGLRKTGDCDKAQHARKSKCYSINGCFYPEDVPTRLERSSWNSQDICKTGNSPQVLLAAEILFEMASCSKSVKSHEEYRRVKLALPPLYKPMKPPKFLCSLQRSESYFDKTKHHDNDRTSGLSSIDNKPNGKKSDLKYVESAGRDHIRWPAPLDNRISPYRLEKNVQVSQQPLDNVSVRSSSFISSKQHLELDANHREKLSKKTLVAANGALIKDWSKGRSKRL